MTIGTRIRTLVEDEDLDHHDNPRRIPIGTEGRVVAYDGDLYDIAWDNGGWTRWTHIELLSDSEIVK